MTPQTTSVYYLSDDQRAVYRRFAPLALPRHTSYPIAPVWTREYRAEEFREDLQGVRNRAQPISLYVHLPYCRQLCYYCACTKEIIPDATRLKRDPVEDLLLGMEKEADHVASAVGEVTLDQIHWGGGTPTFLTARQITHLWEMITTRFSLSSHAEIAVEIDPRTTSAEHLETLRGLGFNRVSLGVQDFDERVQKAVNRLQPFEVVQSTVETCRKLGFESINFDLIYGLPFQTLETMERTLAQVIELAPDRIAFYRLAMIPEMFRWQNVFRHTDLPAGDLPLDLNLLAINRFLEAGYEFVGLDHFAKPTEALARAAKDRSLHRNFQGMTTKKALEIVGLGPSAISQLESSIAQNAKSTHDWRTAVELGLATERGKRLTRDDQIRREIIQQLYSFGRIDTSEIDAAFGIAFEEMFADELERLRDLEQLGIVHIGEVIELTEPLGRLLVRVPAAIFDHYLPRDAYREGLPAGQSSNVG